MTKKKLNINFFNDLIDRVFLLFPDATDAIIAEKLGIVRQVVQGWRSGKSKPTLEQLGKIVELTSADWQWLMSGKSESIDYLIERFFPKVNKRTFDGRYENYEYARVSLLGTIMFPQGGSEKLSDLVYAIAVTWQSAVDKEYPDVLKDAKSELTSIHNGKYINFTKNYKPSQKFLSKAVKLAEEIRASHIISQKMSELHRMRDMSIQELIRADAEPPAAPKEIPAPNAARPREPINFVLEARGLPVVGKAAADETQGARAGFFPPDPEAHFDQVAIPETTSAVEIIGDSMSPVLLNGQYALLGPEYTGPYNQPKNYEIVVADVEVRDGEQAGSDTRWEGVYCKRIIDAGDIWVFLSINPTGTPFSAAKANCRIWPVIGVWFAGKGVPPED